MENLDKKQCGDNGCKSSCQGGTCGEMHSMSGCGGCHGGKHHLKKMILKLIIVILIFWCGFKLGEITGSIRAEIGQTRGTSGWGMMRGYSNYSNNLPNTNGAVIVPAQ